MENDFWNLTATVWANLDLKNQELWFFKVLISLLYAVLSGGTLLQSVMSQQYNCIMELYTNFTAFFFTWKYFFALLFYLRYVRAKIIVHAFMIELDQPGYWYPRRRKNLWKSTCTMSTRRVVLLFYCGWYHRFWQSFVQRGWHTNFAWLILLNGLSKFAQKFTVGFVKLLSTRPIHIVWGNFPFNDWFCLHFSSRRASKQLLLLSYATQADENEDETHHLPYSVSRDETFTSSLYDSTEFGQGSPPPISGQLSFNVNAEIEPLPHEIGDTKG